MKLTWTIIGVRDVAHSFRWYQSLLGLLALVHSTWSNSGIGLNNCPLRHFVASGRS